MLLDTTETFFSDLGEKLSLIAALGFFLYYFMKELKEERAKNDLVRKSYEDKIEKLIEKNNSLSISGLEAMNKSTQSHERLIEVIEDLKETILNSPTLQR